MSHRYLWGPAVDMLLADEQVDWTDNGYGDGDVLWALSDHLGSVGHVVDSAGQERIRRQFDGFGNVVAETHYNAVGGVVTTGAGFVDVAFGYTGKFFDDWTGLQQNWHRWYDAAVGRWISQDPIGFAGGDANLSRYAANSTLQNVDPDGLDSMVIAAASGQLQGTYDPELSLGQQIFDIYAGRLMGGALLLLQLWTRFRGAYTLSDDGQVCDFTRTMRKEWYIQKALTFKNVRVGK